MDWNWNEFFRGFFGQQRPQPSTPAPAPSQSPDLWPPPPPIADFFGVERNEEKSFRNNGRSHVIPVRPSEEEVDDEPVFPRSRFFWGNRPSMIRPPQEGEGRNRVEDDFGFGNNQFVFSNMFAAVGEMFQEVERSMRDMEQFFGNMTIEDSDRFNPPGGGGIFPGHQIPGIAPAHPEESTVPAIKKDENLRDFVMKDGDSGKSSSRSKHYIDAPKNSSEKVDRDLDQLYRASKLDLSDLPVPSKGNDSNDNKVREEGTGTLALSPYDPHQGQQQQGIFKSFSQRTYQTYTFRNGRVEGEIVKEDNAGRHVTKYYQDENGQRHETTEFFPRDGSSSKMPSVTGPSDALVPHSGTHIFSFFDRFFRPRM